jgi:hypothetical protein
MDLLLDLETLLDFFYFIPCTNHGRMHGCHVLINSPSFFIAENARLIDLLDNRDVVLRKSNKEKWEYRSFLGEA